MKRALDILVLSAYLPWPGHGGGLLVGNSMRELNQRHNVTLLTYVSPDEELHVADVARLCRRLKTVSLPCGPAMTAMPEAGRLEAGRAPAAGVMRRAWRALPPSMRSRAYEIRRLPSRRRDLRQATWSAEVAARLTSEFREALSQLAKEMDFDVVLAEWPEMVPYSQFLPARAVKVFESIELRSVTYQRNMLTQRSIDASLFWYYQWRKMRQLEALATRQFDIVTAVSRKEAGALERYGGTAQIVINPFGLDLTDWPREDSVPRWENLLVFLGRMSYPPNQDAVRYFLAQIYAQIRARSPGVRFMVLGGDPPADILAHNGVDGVRVTGFVFDAREYLLKGTVFVLPMRQGAGIKVKAMEALAAGIPVVATPEGTEGLDYVEDGRDLMIANSPGDFAARTIQLLQDAELRQRISESARRMVWQHYDCAVNVAQLEQLYLDEVAKRALQK